MKVPGLMGMSVLSLCLLAVRGADACPSQRHVQKGSRAVAEQEPKSGQEPFALAGARSQIRNPRNVVARDEKAFAIVWAEHARQFDGTVPPIPKVDFKKLDVVAVFLGSLPTGGHTVEIGEIKRDAKRAVVKATHFKPSPNTFVTQAFTSPFAMKAVPKLPPIVTFETSAIARK